MRPANDPDLFMRTVMPAIEAKDPERLSCAVGSRWRASDLHRFLRHDEADVRRVAAVTLGFIGTMSSCEPLTQSLHDPDAVVHQMAEHGLWSIWLRAGSERSADDFREGVRAMNESRYEEAAACLDRVTRIDPGFVEGFNQHAIALYFLGDYRGALRRGCAAVRGLATHFGAIAGMGHCYAQLGNLDLALRCYLYALRVNPRMPVIARTIRRLQVVRLEQNSASGADLLDTLLE